MYRAVCKPHEYHGPSKPSKRAALSDAVKHLADWSRLPATGRCLVRVEHVSN